jgi:hypothetical protein
MEQSQIIVGLFFPSDQNPTKSIRPLCVRSTTQRRSDQFAIVTIGLGDRQADGNPVRLGQHAAFDAPFASIRRVGTGFFPCPTGPWSLPRPSPAKTNPTLEFVVLFKAHLPEPLKDPGGHPFLKPTMRRASGTDFRLVQRLPLAPGSEHK